MLTQTIPHPPGANVDHFGVTMLPKGRMVAPEIPDEARSDLQDAIDTVNSPKPSILAAAAAVDGMLKAKGFKEGSLYKRIDDAVESHVLTQAMGEWAHWVRLDANGCRHADLSRPARTTSDAELAIEFATALGHYLFVLPAKVSAGIDKARSPSV